ncbi:MAG: hypothetical protein NWE76_05880, partial [Candidatus Bathyarchaeota archaeon]|nr:hypothetical protein [Candidatus Bathyarchaeota archaeon]
HMEVAESYYLKAGLRHASEYARATNMLFDAYAYIHRAETETGPMKKTKYLEMAERLLQTSAGCYTKAKHPEKDKQVRRLLESIKTRREITISLAEVLHSATVASSTASISTPLSTYEEAVGLERFERSEIHANLSLNRKEATIGEEIDLRLDLVNTGNQPVLLVRVNNLVPPGLGVRTVHPSHYSITDGLIDMKGRKIDPLKVESIEIRIEATRTGIASSSPDITYVSETGEFRMVRPQPASVTIHPQLTFEFRTEAAQKAFNLLSDAFVQDYMRRKLPLERSGWRTLMQIVRQGKVPKSSVYGPAGHRGRAISELERRGLVETRIFQGERGRGGNIVKARVFYEKETIKRHIDRRTMKNREK